MAPLADGRVFLADEALRLKLIDGIGYSEDARRKIAELLETDAVSVYRYDERVSLLDMFAQPRIGTRSELGRFLSEGLSGSRLMFRWSW